VVVGAAVVVGAVVVGASVVGGDAVLVGASVVGGDDSPAVDGDSEVPLASCVSATVRLGALSSSLPPQAVSAKRAVTASIVVRREFITAHRTGPARRIG